jgi:hypothetical protein
MTESPRLRTELVSALLLGVAAVATSWIGYESSRWSGRQSSAVYDSSLLRVQANQSENRANQMMAVDVGLFTEWADAYASGNALLDGFYRKRFRDEFKPAFEAWVAQRPLENPEAAPSPFALPEYRLEAREEARRLEADAGRKFRESQEYGTVKDKYIVNAVILAMALFFTGMSKQFTRRGIHYGMLAAAALLALFGIVSILSLPVIL